MMTKRQVEYKREVRKLVSAGKIDTKLKNLKGDWRGVALSSFRVLMRQADPKIVEEVKWIKPSNPLGTVTWSRGGLICTYEVYKNHVRLTFAKGASLNDPKGLFNASLEGNAFRAIVIHEGEDVDDKAFKDLVHSAVAANSS